jgi:hypothetical protein
LPIERDEIGCPAIFGFEKNRHDLGCSLKVMDFRIRPQIV